MAKEQTTEKNASKNRKEKEIRDVAFLKAFECFEGTQRKAYDYEHSGC